MLSRGLRDGNAADATRVAGAATTSANMADGYKFSGCEKVPASYRALGGHKTRHRKPLAAAAPSDEASTSSTAHEKLHQCSLCPRTFSVGTLKCSHTLKNAKNTKLEDTNEIRRRTPPAHTHWTFCSLPCI
jgi:hypothetical protein